MLEKVNKCYNALDLPFCEEEIDKVDRISKEYKDKNTGKKVKSIITPDLILPER